MNNQSTLKIIAKNIDPDDAIDILYKAKKKHIHGEHCKWSNTLMNDVFDSMNVVYKEYITNAISDVIRELLESVNTR